MLLDDIGHFSEISMDGRSVSMTLLATATLCIGGRWRVGSTVLAICICLSSSLARAQTRAIPSAGQAVSQGFPSQRATANVLVTRQPNFAIPFNVPRSSNPGSSNPGTQPTEVQLFVSTDRGRIWQLASREMPASSRFQFQASHDGEYWFASRTVTSFTRGQPFQPRQVELQVLVDTARPLLQLHVTPDDAGNLTVAWQMRDAHLAAETLQIHVLRGGAPDWQMLALPQSVFSGPNDARGQGTWVIGPTHKRLMVRAMLRDRAGNVTTVDRQLDPQRSPSQTGTPAQGQPFAAGGRRPPDVRRQQFAGIASIPPTQIAWPADKRAKQPWVAGRSEATPQLSALHAPQPAPRRQPPSESTYPRANEVRYRSTQNSPNSRAISQPNLGSQVAPQPSVVTGPAVQVMNSTRFDLEYDVSAVGPSGIDSVELWCTQNSGRSWKMWQTDADRQSPVSVSVAGEGLFGFRVVIQGGNGLSGRRPAAGDAPDVVIAVDRTAPQIQITGATYGHGPDSGKLMIRWKASDTQLDSRPISLFYRADAQQSWIPIATRLPNTGNYHWSVDASIPEQFYLRAAAIDVAGNQSQHEPSSPISNDGLVPRGQIRAVRPAP